MTRRRHRKVTEHSVVQIPARLDWRKVVNPYPPLDILSSDQVEDIHLASLRLLRDSGIKFLGSDARLILKKAGASVDEAERIVRFDPELVEELIAMTSGSFTIRARNPERTVELGGNVINFATVGGPSFVSDLDKGRRAGTLEDLKNFFRIVHQLEIFHFCGASPFEPLDVPADSRHLDKYLAAITSHDRVWLSSMLGGYRAVDALKMLQIVHGLSWDDVTEQPLTMGNINVNSPRVLDEPMAEAAIAFAKAGQPVLITPFTLLGAMAPTTMAGALVQQNAEALACAALIQAVNPGAPIVYGCFSSNVDMRSGAPAFGTPEFVRTTLASGQLARRYNLPMRSSGANASNAPDAQASYETCMSVWASVLAHANLLLHGGGWLEGGLVASFEKLIIDAEILQIIAESLLPIPVSEDTMAVDAIASIAPGGHFFGSPHTMERYRDIFYTPLLSDWRNYETWLEDGQMQTAERANHLWKELLEQYEPPPLKPEVVEQLNEYVTIRKSDIEAGKHNAVFDRIN